MAGNGSLNRTGKGEQDQQLRDDYCPRCGSDDLEGDFVSSGGDSAIQDMSCRNCSASWENHYSFDGMSFEATNEVVYVETETEKKLNAEIERLRDELSQVSQGSQAGRSGRLEVENRGSDLDPKEVEDIDRCPSCGSWNIQEDPQRGARVLDGSAYFDYWCHDCNREWTLAGVITRVILKP